ncbi:unnamed protein product, partial [Amoebophrya sp. A25]
RGYFNERQGRDRSAGFALGSISTPSGEARPVGFALASSAPAGFGLGSSVSANLAVGSLAGDAESQNEDTGRSRVSAFGSVPSGPVRTLAGALDAGPPARPGIFGNTAARDIGPQKFL